MKTSVILGLLITLGFVAQSLKGQELDFKSLDNFIDSTLQLWDVPGLAISIVNGGEVIYQKGYGVKDLESKAKVEPQTLFYLASASKPFTSALALLLQQDKKLNIDEPIQSYISGFDMVDKLAAENITLRDMLTHRTGIAREKFFTLNNIGSRSEVRSSYSLFEPIAGFRSNFIYSNENYTVAGDIMAEKAGCTWENLVNEYVFTPLGMKNTYCSKNTVPINNLATPYINWDKKNEKMDFYDAQYLGAAGCIISNVQDLSNFIKLYLDRGKYNGTQLIHPNYLIQQLSAQIPSRPMSPYLELSFECYGIGWFLDYYRGNFHVNHGGVLYGYTSLISFLPYQKAGVAILANKNNTPATTIIERYIYDKLLGLEAVDWNSRFWQQEQRMMVQQQNLETDVCSTSNETIDSKMAKQYVGEYFCNGFGKISIQMEDNKLVCNLRNIKCRFNTMENGRFELYHPVEHQGWTVNFDSQNGQIAGFYVVLGIGEQKVYYKKIKC